MTRVPRRLSLWNTVSARLTQAEWAAFAERADAAGMPPMISVRVSAGSAGHVREMHGREMPLTNSLQSRTVRPTSVE